MRILKSWKALLIGGVLVIVLAVGAVSVLAQEPETTPDPASVPGLRGFGFHGPRGFFGSSGGVIDRDALLADALGITVDELQAAREEAADAALDLAVEEGLITEERAELVRARRALKVYIDHDALLAKALGVSVEDVQAAREERSLRNLFFESDLTPAELRDALEAGYQDAVEQAVADGVITQEQADQLDDGFRFRFRGGKRGHPGFGVQPDSGLHVPFSGGDDA